jgi:hypothetical protein
VTLVGFGTYCIRRLVSDIWFRHEVLKDAKKVPIEKIHEMAKENKCMFDLESIQSFLHSKTNLPQKHTNTIVLL